MSKRIRVVTPVISDGFLRQPEQFEPVAGWQTEISQVQIERGPASIESEFDEALAAFDLTADVSLTVERTTGSQAELMTEMVRRLDALWDVRPPAAVDERDLRAGQPGDGGAQLFRERPLVQSRDRRTETAERLDGDRANA